MRGVRVGPFFVVFVALCEANTSGAPGGAGPSTTCGGPPPRAGEDLEGAGGSGFQGVRAS